MDEARDPPNLPPATERPSRDLWSALRLLSAARVGLGRRGDALPTEAVLAFNAAHACARDAVHAALDVEALVRALAPARVLRVASAADDRAIYLRRPDLGRRLAAASRASLEEAATREPVDLAFVIADGLSATAVAAHAPAVIAACHAAMAAEGLAWRLAPLVVATQARVALSDEIGALLGARLCATLIGERPGLSVSDSLGIYLTYAPRPGRLDSERNCISNIHAQGGLAPVTAAGKLVWLMREARRLEATGIALKDEEETRPALAPDRSRPGLP